MTPCSVEWPQPNKKCAWCIRAALLPQVRVRSSFDKLVYCCGWFALPSAPHPSLLHTWLQQRACFRQGQLINLQLSALLCSGAPEPQLSSRAAVEGDELFPAGSWAVSPALWQLPGPGSSGRSKLLVPRSILWESEQLSRACGVGSAGFGAGSLQGSGTGGGNAGLLSCSPSQPCVQPVCSGRLCGACRPQSCFFFFPALLLHSACCSFSCVASCLLHLNTVKVLHWVFWWVDGVQQGPRSWMGPAGSKLR